MFAGKAKTSCILTVVLFGMAIGGELFLRIALDFPLYNADSVVGYWLKPRQHGVFLFNRDWSFNDDSMGVEHNFEATRNFDLLLVGDSIVLGGNPLRQKDKLGPTLSRETGWSVWPISAASWAMQNELTFLSRHDEMLKRVDGIVFVFNSGDFGAPSSWASEITHPRKYPKSYIWYAFEKCCVAPNSVTDSNLLVAKRDVVEMWYQFNKSSRVPILAVAYPARDEAEKNCNWVPIEFRRVGNWVCYVNSSNNDYFRDNIHPSALGDARLASFLRVMITHYMKSQIANGRESRVPQNGAEGFIAPAGQLTPM